MLLGLDKPVITVLILTKNHNQVKIKEKLFCWNFLAILTSLSKKRLDEPFHRFQVFICMSQVSHARGIWTLKTSRPTRERSAHSAQPIDSVSKEYIE